MHLLAMRRRPDGLISVAYDVHTVTIKRTLSLEVIKDLTQGLYGKAFELKCELDPYN